MNNQKISAIFYEMADFLELKQIDFKPQAYRKAARSIETLSKDVSEYEKKGKLREIAGVGEAIADKIKQFLETGQIKEYEELKESMPPYLIAFSSIPGIGPKKAILLHSKLKLTTIEDLEKAAKDGRIRDLKGFGEKSEMEIIEGISLVRIGSRRMLIDRAYPLSKQIIKSLKTQDGIENISVAGSLRRRRETIGDIDILVSAKDPKKIMDYFTSLPKVQKVLSKGETKSSILTDKNVQVDLRIINDSSFGAALQYFTGSKEHNIELRDIAISKGYKLSEYGIFDRKTDKLIEAKTEEGIYKLLGMQYIPPELRENRGEIKAAINGKLPKLIEYGSLKGDFHSHTKATDGVASIEEMANTAKKLGREYLCITDHSKSTTIAKGLSEEQMDKHLKNIKSIGKKIKGFTLLAGSEVDILPNGELDYPNSLLKKMDVVVGSVHSGFKMSSEQNTKRIIKAMENENLDILGHPTGRRMGLRDAYLVDMDLIFKKAAELGVILEINSLGQRLDLNDINIMNAKSKGCKFVIDSDSHNTFSLGNLHYGIGIARRGWLESSDVVNTMSWDKVNKLLR